MYWVVIMGVMISFYPVSTGEINQVGKNGNSYKLDGFQKCINVAEALKASPEFKVANVSIKAADVNVATELIKSVHTQSIIDAYKTGKPPQLANSSGILWQPKLYDFVLESALVSKLVADECIKGKSALGIVGGGHHAERETPYGFCTINTIAITAKYLSSKGKRVCVMDLDTHYSNGCFDILLGEKNISVFSLWNQSLNKWKYFEPQLNIWHKKISNADEYFLKLQELLQLVKANKPDFMIYHLGLDILESDRMGGIKGINEEEIMNRDVQIQKIAQELNTPVALFLGGAYVNWSKGLDFAAKKHIYNTKLFVKLVSLFLKR